MADQPHPPRWAEYMDLDDLTPAQVNPRRHAAGLIGGMIKEFGFADAPILDERTGRLVVGHGRREDLIRRRDAGEPPPDGVVVHDGRWTVLVQRGWRSVSDEHAKAFLVGHNNSTIQGDWDQALLDEVLGDVAHRDFALAQTTGYAAAYLDGLLDGPAGVDDELLEHGDVPATGARYAETEEEEAARADRVAAYQARYGPAGGGALVEMILVYTSADRREVAQRVAQVRTALGPDPRTGADLKTSEILLRALRAFTAVLDDPAGVNLPAVVRQAGNPDAGPG